MNDFDYTKIEKWRKDRDKVLHSLDVKEYKRFCKRYNIPYSENEKIALAAMHRARLGVTSMTEEEIKVSEKWLVNNGFHPYIKL